jgi:FkbM family methyltransferase
MPVRFGPATFRLPYTGLNPLIEREQMRGLFFEHEELEFLAARLPCGLRIVDVGANTGNHTVFFAGPMQAEMVMPVEPLPRAVAAIRAAVAENRLATVDLSALGKAVGAENGSLRPIPSASAGLGATHFVADAAGGIPRVTLDSLIRGRVDFLKIDVEGMEMEALSGAAGLISAHRPMIYIEVLDARIAEFMAWVDGHKYRVEKLFPDKTHCNYLLAPQGGF